MYTSPLLQNSTESSRY